MTRNHTGTVHPELMPFIDALAALLAKDYFVCTSDASDKFASRHPRRAPNAPRTFDAPQDASARASAPNASIDV